MQSSRNAAVSAPPYGSGMPSRTNAIDDAGRRARRQLDEAIRDLRAARLAAGLSQAAVSRALGCSRQLVTLLEVGRVDPSPIQMARWGAAVGLDIPIRTFAGGAPLRDAGQLRLLRRLHEAVGDTWTWRAEVPVTADPRDRRAIDAVLSRGRVRVAIEAIVRLSDAQAQVRAAMLKQNALGVDRMVIALAKTRHNRAALEMAAPTMRASFPCGPRETLVALREGRLPAGNGLVVV